MRNLRANSLSYFYYIIKLVGNQGGATDKEAVYAGDGKIGAAVARIDGAAVEDRNVFGFFGAESRF